MKTFEWFYNANHAYEQPVTEFIDSCQTGYSNVRGPCSHHWQNKTETHRKEVPTDVGMGKYHLWQVQTRRQLDEGVLKVFKVSSLAVRCILWLIMWECWHTIIVVKAPYLPSTSPWISLQKQSLLNIVRVLCISYNSWVCESIIFVKHRRLIVRLSHKSRFSSTLWVTQIQSAMTSRDWPMDESPFSFCISPKIYYIILCCYN